MGQELIFNPPNRSTHDPNSWFKPDGTFAPPNRSTQDPNSWFRVQPITQPGGVTVNQEISATPKPGSAIDRYYERLGELMPTRRQAGLGDLSQLFGAYAGDERDNRAMRGDFQGNYDRMMLGREAGMNQLGLDAGASYDRAKLASLADKRASDSDALQKLQLGSYLSGGGNATAETPWRAVSEGERTAGGDLMGRMTGQLNAPGYEPERFTPQWNFQPMDPSQYAKPGLAENVGRWGSLATGGLSALDMLTNGRSGSAISGLLGKIPGLGKLFGGGGGGSALSNFGGLAGLGKAGMPGSSLYGASAPAGMASGATGGALMSNLMGKALPIAGIAAGGYGLLKNRGTRSNILNGTQAGAGIGMMAGGPIGAGIGAGIGALAGWGRGAFGVSEAEKANRSEVDQAFNEITVGATPEQQAEAQQAGWGNPQQALASIVLRDKLGPEQADALMQQLYAQSRVRT